MHGDILGQKKSANAINIIAWVTVSVIAFATCCQILVLSVFNGFEGLVQSLYGSFYTDIKILPSKGKTFTLTSAQLSTLKKQPYVVNAALIAEEKAMLQNTDADNAQTNISLKGVDDNYTHVTGITNKIKNGSYKIGTVDEPEIVVGSGIQNAIYINVNPAFPSSKLTLILPKKNMPNTDVLQSLSEGFVQPSGVFSIQQEFDDKYALTNIDFVKQQMGMSADEYSAVEIKLQDKTDLIQAQQALANILGNNYDVQTRYQQNTSLYNTMKLEKWAIYAILTLILIIAAFNMISALTMLVLEKQRDISVLQSLGATKNSIKKIFLSEGLLLGFIGGGIGIAMAFLILPNSTKI